MQKWPERDFSKKYIKSKQASECCQKALVLSWYSRGIPAWILLGVLHLEGTRRRCLVPAPAAREFFAVPDSRSRLQPRCFLTPAPWLLVSL